MKLAKDQKLNAPIYASGTLSKQRYQARVIELIHQGEFFNIYLGEDIQGTQICLKTIRYRNEKKNGSLEQYINFRRAMLFAEHQSLSLSHPSFAEPIVLLAVKNETTEDARLFRKVSQWEKMKSTEPVLVQEYFYSPSLEQSVDKLRQFSIWRRLALFKKVVQLCMFAHEHGYVLQNLHPSQILLNPKDNNNIYFVGMHNACLLKDSGVDRQHPGFKRFPKGILPREAISAEHNFDHRADIFQLGILLYYLLTFHDPTKDLRLFKSNDEGFDISKEQSRLEKSILSLHPDAAWLTELVIALAAPKPELRIPDAESILSYLQNPPRNRVEFSIAQGTAHEIKLDIKKMPTWVNRLIVRIEVAGDPDIVHKEYGPSRLLEIPGRGMGEVFCSVFATDGQQRSTWWSHQKFTVFPEIHLSPIEDLSPDKFGVRWDKIAALQYVAFYLVDQRGQRKKLCEIEGSEAILPPEGMSLPHYESIKIECVPHFLISGQEIIGRAFSHDVYLLPSIAKPTFCRTATGYQFELLLSPKEMQIYSQIELLHNGWPQDPDSMTSTEEEQGKTISFSLKQRELSLFEQHTFSFRVLIDTFGWYSGPSLEIPVEIPQVEHLQIAETTPGSLKLKWTAINHPELQGYEVFYQGDKVGRSKVNYYTLQLPTKSFLEDQQQLDIAVSAIYASGKKQLSSKPARINFQLQELKELLQFSSQCQASPFSVLFSIRCGNYQILSLLPPATLQRRKKGQKKFQYRDTIALADKIFHEDKDIEVGETYEYRLRLEGTEKTLFEYTVEIPDVSISGRLRHVGYEDCRWEIQIVPEALSCLRRLEILRESDSDTNTHSLQWEEEDTLYIHEDKSLVPGTTYTYAVLAYVQRHEKPRRFALGEITTKRFELEKQIDVSYNRANVVWAPAPEDNIQCVEIYDHQKQLLASVRSDTITLENLEPEAEYTFPLKYRYFGGYLGDGEALTFKTLPYPIPIRVADSGIDFFRLRWEIPDLLIAAKLKKFTLEISGNVGKHLLSASTRSVMLKQLHSSTNYQWKLYGHMKSGTTCMLGSGETNTKLPKFEVDIEVGLVHHIQWRYTRSRSIHKIEVHRNDLPLIETTEDELYDSDFKGGEDLVYKFFFILRDGRKFPAGEKKVRPLHMRDLFSSLQIKSSVGSILWDFTQLKKFKFLNYVELSYQGKPLYRENGNVDQLHFSDIGQTDENNQQPLGLRNTPMDFELGIVGIAPTTRKCKKKWTLSIKGIRCNYPDLPTQFAVHPEHCSVYFEWRRMDTELLQQITIRRTSDGVLIYQGANRDGYAHDNNECNGLEQHRKYSYTIEMQYTNYQTTRVMEVYLGDFQPSRFDMREQILDDNSLEIHWNAKMNTSITHIGCRCGRKGSLLSKLFQKSQLVEFSEGKLSIPLPEEIPEDFWYQIVYKDDCGHVFYSPVQDILEPPLMAN